MSLINHEQQIANMLNITEPINGSWIQSISVGIENLLLRNLLLESRVTVLEQEIMLLNGFDYNAMMRKFMKENIVKYVTFNTGNPTIPIKIISNVYTLEECIKTQFESFYANKYLASAETRQRYYSKKFKPVIR